MEDAEMGAKYRGDRSRYFPGLGCPAGNRHHVFHHAVELLRQGQESKSQPLP